MNPIKRLLPGLLMLMLVVPLGAEEMPEHYIGTSGDSEGVGCQAVFDPVDEMSEWTGWRHATIWLYGPNDELLDSNSYGTPWSKHGIIVWVNASYAGSGTYRCEAKFEMEGESDDWVYEPFGVN